MGRGEALRNWMQFLYFPKTLDVITYKFYIYALFGRWKLLSLLKVKSAVKSMYSFVVSNCGKDVVNIFLKLML